MRGKLSGGGEGREGICKIERIHGDPSKVVLQQNNKRKGQEMCFAFADVRFGEIKVILAPVVDLFSFLKSVKLQGLDRGCLYTF